MKFKDLFLSSWTSLRWPASHHTGTSNVDYTKARLLATATVQTGRPLTQSPTKFGGICKLFKTHCLNIYIFSYYYIKSKKVRRSAFVQQFASQIWRCCIKVWLKFDCSTFSIFRTTAPILSFTNRVAAVKRSSNREENQIAQPSRQIIKGAVTRLPNKSEPTNSAAMNEYTKGLQSIFNSLYDG